MTTSPSTLVLYSRPGCHLCEDARALLDALLAERASQGLPAPPVRERNIDEDDVLRERYALVIPVVAFGNHEVELAASVARLRRFLEQALDGVPPG